MKHYKADISVRRVGIITAPRLPPDHPSVRHSSCLHREVFPAADITEARQHAIALVKYPNTPEFLNCLDFYYVPFKTLQWKDWQEPREPEGGGKAGICNKVADGNGVAHRRRNAQHPRFSSETQIHSCESQPFLNGVFKWIVKILVYEVKADG